MRITSILAICVAALCVHGCKMVTVDEYQKLQSPESPYLSQAESIFEQQLIPQLQSSAHELTDLMQVFAKNQDFKTVCQEYGYRQTEDLQCNFAVKLSGKITTVKTGSRRGYVTVELADGNTVRVQTGPVIKDTALRDIQKDINYRDFNDQTVYGQYGELINAKSADISAKAQLAEGETITVIGAFSSWDNPASSSSIEVAPAVITK